MDLWRCSWTVITLMMRLNFSGIESCTTSDMNSGTFNHLLISKTEGKAMMLQKKAVGVSRLTCHQMTDGFLLFLSSIIERNKLRKLFFQLSDRTYLLITSFPSAKTSTAGVFSCYFRNLIGICVMGIALAAPPPAEAAGGTWNSRVWIHKGVLMNFHQWLS